MNKKNLAIYVHIPYCVKKCDYCDFLSGPAGADEQAYYVRVLQKEIRSYETLSTLYTVKSIFFGGGTPSYIDERHIVRVLEQIRACYDVAADAEITIECNPGTLTADKLKSYSSIGINRLSIGLQSANDDELKTLGRIHTFNEFRENYVLARRLGFDNINVDLMSGIPRQTIDSWRYTLDRVTELDPDHISAYSLIIEEGTPFYDRYSSTEGKIYLPSERDDRNMYHYTKAYLAERGYNRYEISNYAKEGCESKHNLVYWRLGEYIGFGLGASSFLGGKRFSNTSDKNEYWSEAKNSYSRFKGLPSQSEKATKEEFMFLGLRTTQGVYTGDFEERFRTSLMVQYGNVIEKYVGMELMIYKDGWLRLTDKGIDVSNKILADFLLDE